MSLFSVAVFVYVFVSVLGSELAWVPESALVVVLVSPIASALVLGIVSGLGRTWNSPLPIATVSKHSDLTSNKVSPSGDGVATSETVSERLRFCGIVLGVGFELMRN
jgi:hypothetical protein